MNQDIVPFNVSNIIKFFRTSDRRFQFLFGGVLLYYFAWNDKDFNMSQDLVLMARNWHVCRMFSSKPFVRAASFNFEALFTRSEGGNEDSPPFISLA